MELLTRIAPREADGAEELCLELGCLPLAIEQAAAYIAQTGVNPRTYLELLGQYPAEMFDSDSLAFSGDAGRTIARIWRVTLDLLARNDPLAGQILRILAWYAPDPIPRTILKSLAAPPYLHKAIGLLGAYSMITIGDDMTVTVHRLVQAVTRTPDSADPHRTPARIDNARSQATTLLASTAPTGPEDPANLQTWRTLLPHIDALAEHALADTDTETTADLLSLTAMFRYNQGALTPAIRLFSRAVTDFARLLGEDHAKTLTARGNLACAYQTAGDLNQAVALHQQVLADERRVLGAEHPTTLSTCSNLASAYETAGDLSRAIALHEKTLADRRRVQGEDHPDTLVSLNQLAGAYLNAGAPARAIPLFKQALDDSIRILGENHSRTLTARCNLATAYARAGDLDRAIPLLEQTLADRRRVLSEDHPDTLKTLGNLAGV